MVVGGCIDALNSGGDNLYHSCRNRVQDDEMSEIIIINKSSRKDYEVVLRVGKYLSGTRGAFKDYSNYNRNGAPALRMVRRNGKYFIYDA